MSISQQEPSTIAELAAAHSEGLSSSSRSFVMNGLTVCDAPSMPCTPCHKSAFLAALARRDKHTSSSKLSGRYWPAGGDCCSEAGGRWLRTSPIVPPCDMAFSKAPALAAPNAVS